jgi:hypothetical protein
MPPETPPSGTPEFAPSPVQPPAAPPAPSAVVPPTVPLTVEEYQRLRGIERNYSDLQTRQQKELEAKEQERLTALAKAGEVQKAFDEHSQSWAKRLTEAETKFATLDGQLLSERKAAVLAEKMAGRVYTGSDAAHKQAAANQLKTLIEPMFEPVREANGSISVREKLTGRPAELVLPELLDSPQFAHFFAATTKGGPNLTGGSSQGQSEGHESGGLESVVADFKARQAQYHSMGLHPRN